MIDQSVLDAGLPLTIPLWDKNTPLAGNEHPHLPRLTIYLPMQDFQTGQLMVVAPGGGYQGLAVQHEGHRVARYLSSHGIAAGVVEYRVAPYRHPAPLLDAQRAIRIMRHQAPQWGLDPQQLGMMGFSAGGHLTCCTAVMPPMTEGLPVDEIDQVDCRPNFFAPMYAVVSIFEPFAHLGSRRNLLGERAEDMEMVEMLSPERHISEDTPPCFLFHTSEDKGVVPQHSIAFYQALREKNVPAELHIYEKGKHGIGLDANHPWGPALIAWLKNRQA